MNWSDGCGRYIEMRHCINVDELSSQSSLVLRIGPIAIEVSADELSDFAAKRRHRLESGGESGARIWPEKAPTH